MLAGLSRCVTFRMPPDFCASAPSSETIGSHRPSIKAQAGQARCIGRPPVRVLDGLSVSLLARYYRETRATEIQRGDAALLAATTSTHPLPHAPGRIVSYTASSAM